MGRLSGAQVASYARQAGFTGDALVKAVAIAGWNGSPVSGESGGDPNAVGDTTLQTSKWGPSIGLWQVRSLNNPGAYSGVDALRVRSKLFSPSYNAMVAYRLYQARGGSFRDWSVYTSGIYRANMGAAQKIVGGSSGEVKRGVPKYPGTPNDSINPPTATPVGFDPTDLIPNVPGAGAAGWLTEKTLEALGLPDLEALLKTALWGTLAVFLIILGSVMVLKDLGMEAATSQITGALKGVVKT